MISTKIIAKSDPNKVDENRKAVQKVYPLVKQATCPPAGGKVVVGDNAQWQVIFKDTQTGKKDGTTGYIDGKIFSSTATKNTYGTNNSQYETRQEAFENMKKRAVNIVKNFVELSKL